MVAGGMAQTQSRSAVFVALVLGVLLLIAANRYPSRPVFAGVDGDNPWLWRMAVIVLLLLGLVFSVPALRQIMGLALVDGSVLLPAAAMGCLSVIWLLLA